LKYRPYVSAHAFRHGLTVTGQLGPNLLPVSAKSSSAATLRHRSMTSGVVPSGMSMQD
jgi:hypothetical protein